MKRQISLFVIMGLLACGSSVARADLLFNGNWDLIGPGSQALPTPVGWTVVTSGGANPSDSASSEDFGGAANVFAPGGKGVFYKTFQGTATNPVSVILYQNVAAGPGSYTLTGWAGAGSGYSGFTPASGTQSLLVMNYLDSSSNILGSAVLDLQANGLGVGAPTPPATAFSYHPFSVSGNAPVGTVSVQSALEMLNAYPGPQGGDAAFVGDWLTLVPEPSVISLAVLGMSSLLMFRRRR